MPVHTPQFELTEFLQCEVLHTLGSYGMVVRRLEGMQHQIANNEAARTRDGPWSALFPPRVIDRTLTFNEALRANLHRPRRLRKDKSELLAAKNPPMHPNPGDRVDGHDETQRWVLDFYASAIVALERFKNRPNADSDDPLWLFGRALAHVHDPEMRGRRKYESRLLDGRLERHRTRLGSAREVIAGEETGYERASAITSDHLHCDIHASPLHLHVVGALIDAHFAMHRAEHLLTHSFGDQIRYREQIDRAVRAELTMSLVLNTFVYVIGRTTPWIFAEGDDERKEVLTNYPFSCDTLTPTYCMWIGNQLSLLALHRRAYARWLLDQPEAAYNDFHKLRRFIRGVERTLDERASAAPGASTFLNGLSALADHHIGRIYRAQHSHPRALNHFDRAGRCLERIEREPEMTETMHNSRWRVHLRISQAKASYEIGRNNRSLLCYVRAWRAFLELADTESSVVANFHAVDRVIAWLEGVEFDTELNKTELVRRLPPLIKQFEMVRGPTHLRVLATDVIARLGHELFILNLPALDQKPHKEGRPKSDHSLAFRCLLQAASLDQASTLLAADLLKLEAAEISPESMKGPHAQRPTMFDISDQVPSGGGQFEAAVRVAEYILQSWLNESRPESPESFSEPAELSPEDRQVVIARQLLSSFLTHTDSSNVKLAQLYRYLMQPPTPGTEGVVAGAARADGAASRLELVCLRRYSSFFPFVPRPSPVLGGGYFVRMEREDDSPFGIVVDPGPDFILNLYRCGYCIADIGMIIVTHDHVDHVDELDALMSVLDYRFRLGSDTFDEDKRLIVVGNRSVVARFSVYQGVGDGEGGRVRFFTFQDWNEMTSSVASTEPAGTPQGPRVLPQRLHLPPRTLRIEPVETVYHVDSSEIAQGFLLSTGDSSILFTSDTGIARGLGQERPSRHKTPIRYEKPIAEAIDEATVIVAHMSSVPIRELREMARFDTPGPDLEPTGSMIDEFERLWRTVVGQAVDEQDRHSAGSEHEQWQQSRAFLVRQLQFAFHVRPTDALRESALKGMDVSPLGPLDRIKPQSPVHLYLRGLLVIAERLRANGRGGLLLVGELREELGSFRTRVARSLNEVIFEAASGSKPRALTADIGLRVSIDGGAAKEDERIRVMCSTCNLDNDFGALERYHSPHDICEVCVKGEDEGIFYNCNVHDPQSQAETAWLERIERYDPLAPA